MIEEQPVTLSGDDNPVDALLFAVFGGKFLLRRLPGWPNMAEVLNNAGAVIGTANRIYPDGGWSVSTRPFGGYVPPAQIVEVE